MQGASLTVNDGRAGPLVEAAARKKPFWPILLVGRESYPDVFEVVSMGH